MKAFIGVGIPGSGKTTILKPFAQDRGLMYVNRDDIREKLTGDPTNHTKEPEVTRLMYERIAEGLKETGVVVDATHAKARDRRSVIEFCRQNGALEVVACWYDVLIKVALERNKARSRNVPEAALQKMHNRLKENPPHKSEGFDDVLRNWLPS